MTSRLRDTRLLVTDAGRGTGPAVIVGNAREGMRGRAIASRRVQRVRPDLDDAIADCANNMTLMDRAGYIDGGRGSEQSFEPPRA